MGKAFVTRALRVAQDGKTPLFSFYVRGKDILEIADISRIKRDEEGTLLGYQRGEVGRHVDEIVEYLDSDSVLFPNAIILALSSEAKFKKSRGPQVGDKGTDAGVLEIPRGKNGQREAWIVDGQQRTMALSKAKNSSIPVPVTAFISDDFEVHRSQFLLVNKAKPLPNGLINELLPAVNTALPASLAKNKIPSALCDILNKDPESPFCGLIRRETTSNKNKIAVVKDTSMLQVIKTSLNSVHGCLYQYRNVATGEIDLDSVRLVINLFWGEVKLTFPEAWGRSPKRSRLMGGVGVKSMGVLMDRIMSSVQPGDKEARGHIRKALSRIKNHCAWTQGTWEHLNGVPWNQLQNTSRDVKLLSNMLIRLYTGVEPG
jgi:DGQHR domain-containing protein